MSRLEDGRLTIMEDNKSVDGDLDWQRQADVNAEKIARAIEDLSSRHCSEHDTDIGGFQVDAKRISVMFKTLRPLNRAKAARLWKEFSELSTRKKEEQARKRVAQDEQERRHEERKNDSRMKRDLVEFKIREAGSHALFATSHEELSEARALLNEAREWMRDGWSGFNAMTQVTT